MLKAEIDVLCSWPQRWQVTIWHCSALRRKKENVLDPKASWSTWVTRLHVTRQAVLAGPRAQAIKAGIRTMATSVGLTVFFVPHSFHLWHNVSFKPTQNKKEIPSEVVCSSFRLSCLCSPLNLLCEGGEHQRKKSFQQNVDELPYFISLPNLNIKLQITVP